MVEDGAVKGDWVTHGSFDSPPSRQPLSRRYPNGHRLRSWIRAGAEQNACPVKQSADQGHRPTNRTDRPPLLVNRRITDEPSAAHPVAFRAQMTIQVASASEGESSAGLMTTRTCVVGQEYPPRLVVDRVGDEVNVLVVHRQRSAFRRQHGSRLILARLFQTSSRRSSPLQDQTMIRGFAVRVGRGQTWNRLSGRI